MAMLNPYLLVLRKRSCSALICYLAGLIKWVWFWSHVRNHLKLVSVTELDAEQITIQHIASEIDHKYAFLLICFPATLVTTEDRSVDILYHVYFPLLRKQPFEKQHILPSSKGPIHTPWAALTKTWIFLSQVYFCFCYTWKQPRALAWPLICGGKWRHPPHMVIWDGSSAPEQLIT